MIEIALGALLAYWMVWAVANVAADIIAVSTGHTNPRIERAKARAKKRGTNPYWQSLRNELAAWLGDVVADAHTEANRRREEKRERQAEARRKRDLEEHPRVDAEFTIDDPEKEGGEVPSDRIAPREVFRGYGKCIWPKPSAPYGMCGAPSDAQGGPYCMYHSLEDDASDQPTDQHTTDQHTTDQHTTDQHTTDQHTTDQHTTDQHTTDQHTTDQHTTDQHTTDTDGGTIMSGYEGGLDGFLDYLSRCAENLQTYKNESVVSGMANNDMGPESIAMVQAAQAKAAEAAAAFAAACAYISSQNKGAQEKTTTETGAKQFLLNR
jgi:hypothetical protein